MKFRPLAAIVTVLLIASCTSIRVNRELVSAIGQSAGTRAGAIEERRPAPPPMWDAFRMVFFDSEKANLTAEAQAVIAQIVSWRTVPEMAAELASCKFYIEGHADTAESDPNGLSARRAEAVKREALRLGMPTNLIVVRALGRDEPLALTSPGVAEQQNRRVVISYH